MSHLREVAVVAATFFVFCLLSTSSFGQSSPDTTRAADTLHLVDTLQPPVNRPKQSAPPVLIVNLGNEIYHPDGVLGKPSFHVRITYASVTGARKRPVGDIQRFNFGLNLVVAARLTLLSKIQALVQDSTRYEISGGLRFYPIDPLAEGHTKNPDGPVGGLALTGKVGSRFVSNSSSKSKVVADGIIAVPVSSHLTLGAGYRYYQQMELYDVESGYGSVSVYPLNYMSDSAYVNPDGPVGNLALKVSGGGSANGIFGEFDAVFPFSGDMTITAIIRGERVPGPPYRRSAIAGFLLSYYP